MNEYLESGKIINTHGVRGDIKIYPYTDTPEDFLDFKHIYIKENGDYVKKTVTKVSVFKNTVLMHIKGCDTFEEANSLREKLVYVTRDQFDLSEGQHFIVDIIGLSIIDVDTGKVYGKVTDVIQGVASDIYEVQTDKGTFLVPVVDEFIKEIDLNKGIFIKPIEGLIE